MHQPAERDLYEILDSMAAQVKLGRRFFAIVDKDTEPRKVPGRNARSLMWDVYHIENYLLEPKYIRAAAVALTGTDQFGDEEAVRQALRESAQDIISTLVLGRLQKHVNDQLVSALGIGARPDSPKPAMALLPSINGSLDRVRVLGKGFADQSQLQALVDQFEATLRSSLNDETWMREFPGREILRRFVGRRLSRIANYDAFRNVVIAQMVDGGYKPQGMRKVIHAILATDD